MDGHHIEPWIDGGKTALGNLVSLCRRHHRLVHEYGFRVELTGEEFRLFRPDGAEIRSVPATERIDAEHGVQALRAAHERHGLAINERTGVLKWFGERMDYGEAVGALRERNSAAFG